MEENIPFSKRNRYRPDKKGLIEKEVPKTARIGMCYIIDDQLDYAHLNVLYSTICQFLRIHPVEASGKLQMASLLDVTTPEKSVIKDIIMECDWLEFYDLCEMIYSFMNRGYEEDFAIQVNNLFREERLSYQMLNGKIEKIGNPITDAQIKEVRILLKEPEFKSADELFEKAIKALNQRPKSDSENCIKDAVASVESVGRILRKDKNARIDNIIKDAIQKRVIPKLLGEPIIKLYAYRGDEPAVAHGGIEPSKVTVDEAEFVLAITAAIIIYLVKKRSQLI